METSKILHAFRPQRFAVASDLTRKVNTRSGELRFADIFVGGAVGGAKIQDYSPGLIYKYFSGAQFVRAIF